MSDDDRRAAHAPDAAREDRFGRSTGEAAYTLLWLLLALVVGAFVAELGVFGATAGSEDGAVGVLIGTFSAFFGWAALVALPFTAWVLLLGRLSGGARALVVVFGALVVVSPLVLLAAAQSGANGLAGAAVVAALIAFGASRARRHAWSYDPVLPAPD